MFRCFHCGGCCEDETTQVSLTLGDLQRLCKFFGKSSLQLYKEGKIGVCPFGNPFSTTDYETEIGLLIPCNFREIQKVDGKVKLNPETNLPLKMCGIYSARPMNCRLFPYWILAEADPKEIVKIIDKKTHSFMNHMEFGEEFKEDRQIYQSYKEKIVKLMMEEVRISDEFYSSVGLKKVIKTSPSKSKWEDLMNIRKLVKELSGNDYTKLFKKVDLELKKHNFIESKDIPKFEDEII